MFGLFDAVFQAANNVNVPSSSSNRPTSAGATRSRSGNGQFAYARHNTGNSNLGSVNSGGGSNTAAQVNISGNGLTGHGYASQRPSSAGHSRSGRHHQSSNNNNIHGHNYGSVGGQSSGSNNSGSNPLNMPAPSSSHHQHHQHHHHQQPQQVPVSSQPISHILNTHHIPSGAQQAAAYPSLGAPQPQPGYSRPKSAGAVRRAPTVAPADSQVPRTINLANVYGGTPQQQYNIYTQQQLQQAQMQQQQQAQQQQQQATPHLNHYNVSAGGVIVGGATTTARPLSANATSHTSRDSKAYQLPADHWSTTYKAHYGFSAASAAAATGATAAPSSASGTATGTGTAQTTAPQAVSYGAAAADASSSSSGARPSSASAVQTKLRHAVQMDVTVNNINNVTAQLGAATLQQTAQPNTQHVYLSSSKNAATAASSSSAATAQQAPVDLDAEDETDMGLDTAAVSGTGTSHLHGQVRLHGHHAQAAAAPSSNNNNNNNNLGTEEDDEEMDGKPVDLSRSHPEISMTTPSASLELGHGSSHGGGVDVRNTSLDSFSEDHLVVGLSTVPNQFCTKRDAFELRKLLALSAGTRGGIVPSSSAVMDMYMVGKVVGVGSYGKVRAAWHRLTSSKVAIKTYDKSKLKDPAHWKRVHAEIKIMEQISHPRIARMYEAVETPKRMHLIMECLDGGNLCSYVKAKRRLSEDESKRIFFQIAQAIEHLHALGVSHRDVKLENVLFANDRDIKLIDFGFSTVCQPGKRLKVFCGTPSCTFILSVLFYVFTFYECDLECLSLPTFIFHTRILAFPCVPLDMAPEIVRRSEYEGKPVDMWSMGILLYALLCGCFPFRAKAYPDLYRRIARGKCALHGCVD